MNREIYQSAMNKIKAGKGFQGKIEASLKQSCRPKTVFRSMRMVPVLIIFCMLIYAGILKYPDLSDKLGMRDSTDFSRNGTEKFEITRENSMETASYIAVVYLNGYAYEPIEWFRYSLGLSDDTDYEAWKGKKLGEVTLDLKGKQYRGTPPDFSSTYDVGTEIYEIKNVDPKSGILVNFSGFYAPFYRCGKYVSDKDRPLDLTMSEVFGMLSENPEIVSVELRDEENGAWMNTSDDVNLLSLANKELPEISLLNYGEIEKDSYDPGHRIPVNLIFADGRALHMQAFPSSGMASVFGGFIPISEELGAAFRSLDDQGSPYPRLADRIPYSEEEIAYLSLKNHTNGDEVVCENPAWSSTGLFQILSYYRAEETEAGNSRLVITAVTGRSETDSVTVNFYETADRKILTESGGIYYKPVRGQLLFRNLESYLYNNTDLGNKE